jgi:short-subunit dehydrogenase
VTALCPGPTESEFFEVARASVFQGRSVQSTPEVARLAIAALAKGKRTLIPNFTGRFIAALVRFLPIRMITYIVEKGARPGA